MGKTKYKSAEVKAQYQRERRRVQNFLRRAKKRGYEFSQDVLPKIPKTVTEKSISRLQKLDPANLYSKARVYYNAEGDYYTGTEFRHMENIERGRKSAETRHYRKYDMNKENITNYSVINRVRQLIENSEPKTNTSLYTIGQRDFLLDVIDKSILDSSEEQYSCYLSNNESSIAYLLGRIEYASVQEINLDLFRQLQAELSFYTPDLEQMKKAQEISEDGFRQMTLAEMEENPFL